MDTEPFNLQQVYGTYTADFHGKVTWEAKSYRVEFRDCPFETLVEREQVPLMGAQVSNLSLTGFDLVITDLERFTSAARVYWMTANGETDYGVDF